MQFFGHFIDRRDSFHYIIHSSTEDRLDTKDFLFQQYKSHWQKFGQAIDDLKESFEHCSRSSGDRAEWDQAMQNLDDDFILVQEHFEALTVIDSLYKECSALLSAGSAESQENSENPPPASNKEVESGDDGS